MPRRTILPKVYQRPHPPMWVAVTSPGTELDAADRGLGSLGLTFGQFAEQEKRIAEYRRRIQLCEPVGEFVNDQVSTVNFLYCGEDDAVALKTGRQMANHFNYLAAQLISVRETYPSKSYPSLGLLPQLRRQATGPDASEQAGEGLCLGGPERITRALKRWEACGVDRVNFLVNTAETIPQAEVLASLEPRRRGRAPRALGLSGCGRRHHAQALSRPRRGDGSTRGPDDPRAGAGRSGDRLGRRSTIHPRDHARAGGRSRPADPGGSTLHVASGQPRPRRRDPLRARGLERGARGADDADLGERLDLRHGLAEDPLRDGPGDSGRPRDSEGPLS